LLLILHERPLILSACTVNVKLIMVLFLVKVFVSYVQSIDVSLFNFSQAFVNVFLLFCLMFNCIFCYLFEHISGK